MLPDYPLEGRRNFTVLKTYASPEARYQHSRWWLTFSLPIGYYYYHVANRLVGTNLRDAGVPTEYISTMMGHTLTSGSATTLNYLSRYNMATMMAYNSKLLNNGKEGTKEDILEKLKAMDPEKLAAILKLME